MSRLPLETIAIVSGTLDEVEHQQAAIMLRMWHHLSPSPDREVLFGTFGSGGQALLQGFLPALRQRVKTHWPRLRPPPRLCEDHGPMLQDAFGLALGDVLGPRASGLVLDAWVATLRDFMAEMSPQASPCRSASPTDR